MAEPERAYVWIWLPGATAPVPAGVLERAGEVLFFNYGRTYRERLDAIAIYLPELPLGEGRIRPPAGLQIAGSIRDAVPDAWGQRVILRRLLGAADRETDPAELSLLTYLLESGSDRLGALDFQQDADAYVPRASTGTLEELTDAAARVDAAEPLSAELAAALTAGSSMGGARPKVVLNDGPRPVIAKLSSRSDTYPVVKGEGVAMDLAARVGLSVASTRVTECLGRDVLLVDRFDRTNTPGERRMVVSALTILGLDEMLGRYATYHELADVIRQRFADPRQSLHELFSRIVFNICVSNTDDHARNHAAFWNGETLRLTPAYDICPQPRAGDEAAQAMEIGRDGFRMSQLAGCLTAADVYLLSDNEARQIIDRQLDIIHHEWADAADRARLTQDERDRMWKRQILNPSTLDGYR